MIRGVVFKRQTKVNSGDAMDRVGIWSTRDAG